METAIWTILIIGALYIMIFRGGCCGGHKHGKQKNDNQPGGQEEESAKGKSGCH